MIISDHSLSDLKEIDSVMNFIVQKFPGEILPELPDWDLFPDPNVVGGYVKKQEFLELPKWQSQWVHWQDRTENILNGNYFDLRPVHFEGIFTLVCNFLCPHCTRRPDRSKWVKGGTWQNNSDVTDFNTLNFQNLKTIIDKLIVFKQDNQMGIVWGGGDPTANPSTYSAMRYAKLKGITSSFLTNGVLMDVDSLIEIEPTIVRVSLNCGTNDSYARFHGFPRTWNYFDRVIANIKKMNRLKVNLGNKHKTLFGISLIMDERNIEDFIIATQLISDITKEDGRGIDYVIVRPVMQYEHFEAKTAILKDSTISKAWKLIEKGGVAYENLISVNIPLIPIKDSFNEPLTDSFYSSGTDCLSYGVCSEIRHNGDIQICSDSYGDPNYTIGNLLSDDLDTIWKSEKRKNILENINQKQCYKAKCARNSRGHHHNRIFHQIEVKRMNGEIENVKKWISDLREVTYPLGHSFFI